MRSLESTVRTLAMRNFSRLYCVAVSSISSPPRVTSWVRVFITRSPTTSTSEPPETTPERCTSRCARMSTSSMEKGLVT